MLCHQRPVRSVRRKTCRLLFVLYSGEKGILLELLNTKKHHKTQKLFSNFRNVLCHNKVLSKLSIEAYVVYRLFGVASAQLLLQLSSRKNILFIFVIFFMRLIEFLLFNYNELQYFGFDVCFLIVKLMGNFVSNANLPIILSGRTRAIFHFCIGTLKKRTTNLKKNYIKKKLVFSFSIPLRNT